MTIIQAKTRRKIVDFNYIVFGGKIYKKILFLILMYTPEGMKEKHENAMNLNAEKLVKFANLN